MEKSRGGRKQLNDGKQEFVCALGILMRLCRLSRYLPALEIEDAGVLPIEEESGYTQVKVSETHRDHQAAIVVSTRHTVERRTDPAWSLSPTG